jgi:hypothetical protein
MATTTQNLTTSWTAIAVGPVTFISIQAGNTRVYYTLEAAPPADSEGGHTLDPRDGASIEVSNGETLYARASSSGTGAAILYITQ